jgi:ABC-2 type transport system permease protein
MIALARPGSLPWLVLHDVRVKARGREGRWGRIIAMLLLALLPIVGGAVMAWRVRGGADLPLAALGSVGAVLLGMMLVMVSSAYAHVLRLGRDRGELELLLTAPLPVALPFLLLTAPFFLFSAAFGHVTWVAGPLVVVSVALVATALALTIATLLDRLLGPKLAKLVAQVAWQRRCLRWVRRPILRPSGSMPNLPSSRSVHRRRSTGRRRPCSASPCR